MDTIVSALCSGLGLGVALIFVIALLRQFLVVARPNELLVLSGRSRTLDDGIQLGYREIVGGGRAFRIPMLEKIDRMDMTTIPIEIQITNAYSKGGIPLSVHAVANIKVSSDPVVMKNAIERFLGRNPIEIKRVGKETLEGHLRGVLATLTPEEVNEDRLKFANALIEEAEEDFHKLGLALDTLKVQHVSDDVEYLDSIGRQRIAEVIRDAEVAEADAIAEAKSVEAHSKQIGDIAGEKAATAIVIKENELRQLKAELEAEAKAEEERAVAAANQARAAAQTELEGVRQQLETLRLEADIVLPAEAEKNAAKLRAEGAAASIEENGTAMAEVLELMTGAWLKAGDDASDIFLIQQLEDVLETVVTRLKGLKMEEVVLLDGGDGQALPRHIASFPGMVRQVLNELHASTGVDVTGILTKLEPKISVGSKGAQ